MCLCNNNHVGTATYTGTTHFSEKVTFYNSLATLSMVFSIETIVANFTIVPQDTGHTTMEGKFSPQSCIVYGEGRLSTLKSIDFLPDLLAT